MSVSTENEDRFAVRLRKLRKARGLSAQRLGQLTGMTRAAISKIECRVRSVTLDEAIALAAGLEVPLRDMYAPGPVKSRFDVTVD
jgi:transcriptional regulator with XRE-family HTH domain